MKIVQYITSLDTNFDVVISMSIVIREKSRGCVSHTRHFAVINIVNIAISVIVLMSLFDILMSLSREKSGCCVSHAQHCAANIFICVIIIVIVVIDVIHDTIFYVMVPSEKCGGCVSHARHCAANTGIFLR